MASDFVDIPIATDPSTLADDAITYLQTQWAGWVPNDGDMEVIMAEALAPMAADAAEVAAQMPKAALRAYGTDILGIAYGAGAPATTTITLTFIDSNGHTVLAGAEVEIDGYAFATVADVTVASGANVLAGVAVNAITYTSDANGLAGAVAASISLPSFVDHFTVDRATSGGVDPDDDDAFADRISRELRLRGRTLITATDFVLAALDQPGITYAVATGNTARAVAVGIADANGNPVSTAIKSAYQAVVAADRLVNTTVTINDPTYTTVGATYRVQALPGFDTTDLVNRINTLLTTVLSPDGWLNPPAGQTPNMHTDTIVRPNWLIGVIASVAGVDYVESATITGAAGDGTLTLAGAFPLPQAGVFNGTADPA